MAVHHAREFGGPIGTFGVTLLLPAVVYGLYAYCDVNGCPPGQLWPPSVNVAELFTWRSNVIVFAWIMWFALLYVVVPPSSVVKGVELEDGSRLGYPINAFRSCVVTVVLLVVLHTTGTFDLAWVANHIGELALAATIQAFALSALLYIASIVNPKGLAPLGNTGNPMYDFFMGHQLNPRIGSFDLKYFCELRPGLIGWAVINAALMLEQYRRHGHVTNSMVLVNLLEGFYVLDALWFEHCIVTSMDITTDGFGLMLAFGDLAWVPFTYTMQARYLVQVPVSLSPVAMAGVIAVVGVGFYIFRSANWQKDAFRKNPTAPGVRHLTYLKTQRGTKLLTSGWWGVSRHCNYLGDWIMGVGWCLPCGFGSPIPYFYAIYFACLLMHRERRDEAKCHAKYGKDWDKYCSIVKWRIVPYVY